ncbi:MAG: hypothetical protein JEZ04_07930 [Spirochaetales bacterium]|nr:hypothetical protein [Spirochaetales bacterium]
MKKLSFLLGALLVISFFSCTGTGADQETGTYVANTGELIYSPYVGSFNVQATVIADSVRAALFGNNNGTFKPAGESRAVSINPRAAGDNTFGANELLRRYTTEELLTELKTYSFTSFKVVADIFLKSSNGETATLLYWGGEDTDLSNYVDLVTGKLESTSEESGLKQTIYETVLIQLNAPAETIIPDFGDDAALYPDITKYSWSDLKPFFSTSSSAQHIIISTFVDKPFAAWLGGDFEDLDTYQEVQDYNNNPENIYPIEDLGAWVFSAPINKNFFEAVAACKPAEDPNSGEAMVFLPMYDAIDLREIDNVSITFEMFMKGLLEVYPPIPGETRASEAFVDNQDRVHVLSSGKTYIDEDGNTYYAPLPIKVSYKANPDGMAVAPFINE